MTPFMPGEVNNFQQTIRREREFVGIGLHNGRVAKVNLRPLDENSGILFRRMDLNKKEIPADSANVSTRYKRRHCALMAPKLERWNICFPLWRCLA